MLMLLRFELNYKCIFSTLQVMVHAFCCKIFSNFYKVHVRITSIYLVIFQDEHLTHYCDNFYCSSNFFSLFLVVFSVSGLSPFMGDNDIETLSNVTSATWDFEDDAFDEISDEAKDFISNLLKKDMK